MGESEDASISEKFNALEVADFFQSDGFEDDFLNDGTTKIGLSLSIQLLLCTNNRRHVAEFNFRHCLTKDGDISSRKDTFIKMMADIAEPQFASLPVTGVHKEVESRSSVPNYFPE